jgi:hypothetical protein
MDIRFPVFLDGIEKAKVMRDEKKICWPDATQHEDKKLREDRVTHSCDSWHTIAQYGGA